MNRLNLVSKAMFSGAALVRNELFLLQENRCYSQQFWPGSQRWERWGWVLPASQTFSLNSPVQTLQGDKSLKRKKKQSVMLEWFKKCIKKMLIENL